MGPYWRTIGYGSIVGIVLSVGILNLYYLIFATEYTLQTFIDAAKWGTILALISSAFVTIGTIAFARKLNTARGKGLFIAMSVVSPIVGWILFGVINGLLFTWIFFFGYPLIGAASGVMAGIVAALATFFMPQSASRQVLNPTEDPLDVFD